MANEELRKSSSKEQAIINEVTTPQLSQSVRKSSESSEHFL